MADPNLDAEEYARLIGQASEELRVFGRITDETSLALRGMTKASEAMKTAGQKAADALGSLTNFALTAGAAMQKGSKGATAFTQGVDELGATVKNVTSGLLTMAGVFLMFSPAGRIGRVLASLGITSRQAGIALAGTGVATAALTDSMTKLTQAALAQADALYLGYTTLSKSSGSAADGMRGVFDEAKALGLSFDELAEYSNTIASNSADLVLFGGSVKLGRKNLADIGLALESSREGFLRMGMNMNDVAKGMIASARFQRIAGDATIRTAADIDRMALAASKYIVEQDRLTKLTGMSADEQERAREEVRSQERFAGRLEELRQQGEKGSIAAKKLEDTFLLLVKYNKQAALGFADAQTGFVQTEAAQKAFMGTQGEVMVVADELMTTELTAVAAAQRIAQAHGRTATELGATLGQIGSYNDIFGDLYGDLKLRGLGEKDMVKILKDAENDREKLLDKEGKDADQMLVKQAELIRTQIDANKALNLFVDKAVVPAQQAMIYLTRATYLAGDILNKVFDGEGAISVPGAGGEKGATAAKGTPQGGGRYGRLPGAPGAAPGAAAAGGGGGLKDYTAADLKALGLSIKEGDVQAPGAKLDPRLIDMAQKIQRVFGPEFAYFSGFADLFHQDRNSKHNAGLALDFVLKEPPSEDTARRYVEMLRELGASKVLNEYHQPSAGSTGGHFHVEIAALAKGGITQGPSIAGEAGPEAVVPLPDGKTIPVRLEGSANQIVQEYLKVTGTGPIALKDALARPESMPGLTEYGGYNMGPMRTDLEVVAKIAEKLGAYDAATQTITDPATWKQILFEGMGLSSNMALGGMNVGSQTFGSDIGDVLADAVKETMEQDRVDLKTALREVGKEWSDAMRMSMDAMTRAGEDPVAQAEIIAELRAIAREQARTADASQRMAAAAAN